MVRNANTKGKTNHGNDGNRREPWEREPWELEDEGELWLEELLCRKDDIGWQKVRLELRIQRSRHHYRQLPWGRSKREEGDRLNAMVEEKMKLDEDEEKLDEQIKEWEECWKNGRRKQEEQLESQGREVLERNDAEPYEVIKWCRTARH